MSSIMRCRSALTGRSIVGTGIGSSSHDEGNSMLERQLNPAQDVIENAHQYRGPGARPLAGFGAAPQPYLLHRSMVRVPGIIPARITNPAERVRAWLQSGTRPAVTSVMVARVAEKLIERSAVRRYKFKGLSLPRWTRCVESGHAGPTTWQLALPDCWQRGNQARTAASSQRCSFVNRSTSMSRNSRTLVLNCRRWG